MKGKKERGLGETQAAINCANIHPITDAEGREQAEQSVHVKRVKRANCPNLMKIFHVRIQAALWNMSGINARTPENTHIIVKLLKRNEDGKEVPKAAGEKELVS